MSEMHTITLEKPQTVLQRDVDINFRASIPTVGKMVINALFLNWSDVAKDGTDLLEHVGLAETTSEIAWSFVFSAFAEASAKLSQECLTWCDENAATYITSLESRIKSYLDRVPLTIDHDFFDQPKRSDIVEKLGLVFVEWLKSCGVDDLEAQARKGRFPIYFQMAIHDQLKQHPDKYSVLLQETHVSPEYQLSQAWLHYYSYLQQQVQLPMFLEAFSLSDVYIDLRASYETAETVATSEDSSRRKLKRKKVVDLHQRVYQWVKKADQSDPVLLISGGPGSGKSSFAKMFASKIAEAGDMPVILIPLHRFNLEDDMVSAIGSYLQDSDFLPSNPLESKNRDKNILIIFDGLDELSQQGRVGEKSAQSFMRSLYNKIPNMNRASSSIKVIVTGRDVVIQQQTDNYNKASCLQVLPYHIADYDISGYEGDPKIIAKDQRDNWWVKYGLLTGENFDGMPEQYKKGKVSDITAQPLLNYLVALSCQKGQMVIDENTNINSIYEKLLSDVYNRGWDTRVGHKGHIATQGLSSDEFMQVMESIALSTWHGTGRTTTVKEILDYCNQGDTARLLARFQSQLESDNKTAVTRLLAAFYFRSCGTDQASGDKAFEFTHKSFGEYLTAKRIIREIYLINEEFDRHQMRASSGWDANKVLNHWVDLCGVTKMTHYIMAFICDEMKLINLHDQILKKWQINFSKILSHLIDNDYPMEINSNFKNFKDQKKSALIASDTLMSILGVISSITETHVKLDLKSSFSFCGFLGSMMSFDYSDILHDPDHFDFCEDQDLSFPYWFSFFDLSGFFFRGLVFNFFNFSNCRFEGCRFNFCIFEGAIFDHAFFKDVEFLSSSLQGGRFNNSIIESVEFSGCNISFSNFEGALIKSIKFSKGISLSSTKEMDPMNFSRTIHFRGGISFLKKAKFDGASFEVEQDRITTLKLVDICNEISLKTDG